MPVLAPAPTISDLTEFPDTLATKAYLGDTGIILGDTDASGVRWRWAGDDPWTPGVAPREQVGDRNYGHGQWDATRFYGPRTIHLTGTCRAPTHALLHAAKQRLADAINITPFLYRVTEPGFDRFSMARRQGEVMWTELSNTMASWSAALFCPDPVVYSSGYRSTGPIFFPTTSGGMAWPAIWPATWDAVTITGRTMVTNPGTYPTYPIYQAVGPVADISIVAPETGLVLTINNPDGPTLGVGEWLDIDVARHQVLLLGTGGRRSWASGDWFGFEPGETEIAIGSSDAGVDAYVTAVFRGTWIP